MTTMFKVQDNVPLPPIKRAPKTPRRKFPIEGMEVGQMFFMPGRSTKSVSAYVSRITKGLPGKYSARHCWMKYKHLGPDGRWEPCEAGDRGATEGVGVWRIE